VRIIADPPVCKVVVRPTAANCNGNWNRPINFRSTPSHQSSWQSGHQFLTIRSPVHDNPVTSSWQSGHQFMTIRSPVHDNLVTSSWQSGHQFLTIRSPVHENPVTSSWQSGHQFMTIRSPVHDNPVTSFPTISHIQAKGLAAGLTEQF
jgi:hypothetical protein